SVESRRANKQAKEAKKEQTVIAQQDPSSARLTLLSKQIARTDKRLRHKDVSDKDRAALLRALDALIERERILMQRPGPPKFSAHQSIGARRELPRVTPAIPQAVAVDPPKEPQKPEAPKQ